MDLEILELALHGIRAYMADLRNKERILEAQIEDFKRGTVAGQKPVRLSKNGKRLGRPPKKGE